MVSKTGGARNRGFVFGIYGTVATISSSITAFVSGVMADMSPVAPWVFCALIALLAAGLTCKKCM